MVDATHVRRPPRSAVRSGSPSLMSSGTCAFHASQCRFEDCLKPEAPLEFRPHTSKGSMTCSRDLRGVALARAPAAAVSARRAPSSCAPPWHGNPDDSEIICSNRETPGTRCRRALCGFRCDWSLSLLQCFRFEPLGLERRNHQTPATPRRIRPQVRLHGNTTQAVEYFPPPRSRGTCY
jgi:hypothetical protein